jgi:hypothetical protein
VTGRGRGTEIRGGVAVARGVAIVEIVDVDSGGLQKKLTRWKDAILRSVYL